MTVANRSPAPTVQNLPDNRAAMSLIARSATPIGGFGLMQLAFSSLTGVQWTTQPEFIQNRRSRRI